MRKLSCLFGGMLLAMVAYGQNVVAQEQIKHDQTVYTLQEAITAACKNNADLNNKRLDTESMKAMKSELYTRYFPHVSASATYFERNRGLAEGSSWLDNLFALINIDDGSSIKGVQILKRGFMGGVTAIQPIYTGGRLTAANKLAELGIDATKEMTAVKQDELIQEVESYFWQLVQLYETERSLQTMDSLVQYAAHDASLALKAGLVTTSDRMQVDIHASKLQGVHLQVSNGKDLCKEYLAYLLGTERVDSIVWEDIYQRQKPDAYFTDPHAAMIGRHETNLLQMQLSSAQLKRKLVKGNMLPVVGVGFAFNYHYFFAKNDYGVYHNFFDHRPTAWVAGLNVSIPISGWWTGKHALCRADVQIAKAQNELDDKKRKMMVQISLKWKTLNEKYKQIDIALKQLQQSAQNQRQQASAYRSGSISMTNRLQADALYEEARTHYIDACIKYKLAVTDYLHVTGR